MQSKPIPHSSDDSSSEEEDLRQWRRQGMSTTPIHRAETVVVDLETQEKRDTFLMGPKGVDVPSCNSFSPDGRFMVMAAMNSLDETKGA